MKIKKAWGYKSVYTDEDIMEKRIFISHSSKDNEIASKICEALENNGMKCWVAPRDIPYGKEWAGEISKAIENSAAFLFLSSGNSNASGQVSREIQLAIQNSLPIIPVKLDDADYSDTNKYYLATIHCMLQYEEAKITKLVSDISKAVPKAEKNEEDLPVFEKPEKKKKQHFFRNLALSSVWAIVCGVAGAVGYYFTDINQSVKIALVAAAVIVGIIPVMLCRKKAVKSYTVSKVKANICLAVAILCFPILFVCSHFYENYLWMSDLESKYRITLTASEEMSIADFDAATKTVKNRMDVIADGERYSIEVDADKINLLVPYEFFGKFTAPDMLKCYVSRAIKLYITATDIVSNKDKYEVPEIEVPREAIESVSLKQGKIPGVSEVPEKNVKDSENYEYIEIVLNKDFVKDNKDAIDSFDGQIVFAQDVESTSNFYYYYTYKSDKENVFYLLNNDTHTTVNDVLVYNLTNEPMADSLYYSTTIGATWENTEQAHYKGKNQCNIDELSGETCTVKFKGGSYVTEGGWLDTVKAFKNRLDSLGQQYAFGTALNEAYTITVRLGTQGVNEEIFTLLTENAVKLLSGLSYSSIMRSYKDDVEVMTVTEKGDDVILELFQEKDGTVYSYSEFAEFAKNNKENRIYLVSDSDNIPLLSAKAVSEESKLCFDTAEFGFSQKLSKDNRWIADLARSIYDNRLEEYLSYEQYNFDTQSEQAKFGLEFDTADTQQSVLQVAPESEVEVRSSAVEVYLELDVDDTLPEKAIETARKIYEALDFPNSNFSRISVYLIEEQGEERARIFFSKYYQNFSSLSTADGHEDGFVYYYNIYRNGRLEQTRDEFTALIEKDEFYQSVYDEEWSNLY